MNFSLKCFVGFGGDRRRAKFGDGVITSKCNLTRNRSAFERFNLDFLALQFRAKLAL
jgi:hypothetical protein